MRHRCRVGLANPDACRREIPSKFLACGRCWRLVPREKRRAVQEAFRAAARAGVGERDVRWAEWRRLVDELVAGVLEVLVRTPPPKRRTEYVEPEEKRYADGVRECPRCRGHKHTCEFVLLEPGTPDPRGSRFGAGVELVESLAWFVYPPCTLCDAKGIVSSTRAAHWVKCQEARR
jgi:hypothetical protein